MERVTPPLPSHILFFINCFQVGPEVALQRKVEAQENSSRGISEERKQEGVGSRPWKIHCQGKKGQHLVCIKLRELEAQSLREILLSIHRAGGV